MTLSRHYTDADFAAQLRSMYLNPNMQENPTPMISLVIKSLIQDAKQKHATVSVSRLPTPDMLHTCMASGREHAFNCLCILNYTVSIPLPTPRGAFKAQVGTQDLPAHFPLHFLMGEIAPPHMVTI